MSARGETGRKEAYDAHRDEWIRGCQCRGSSHSSSESFQCRMTGGSHEDGCVSNGNSGHSSRPTWTNVGFRVGSMGMAGDPSSTQGNPHQGTKWMDVWPVKCTHDKRMDIHGVCNPHPGETNQNDWMDTETNPPCNKARECEKRCKKALHARTPGRNRCRSSLIQMDNIDRTMQKEGTAVPSHVPLLSQRGSGSMRWKRGCGLTRSPVLPGCSRGWILVLRSKVSREMGRHTEQKSISIPNTSTCKQARMVTRNILVETMQFRL